MRIKIVDATPDPISLISRCAGMSYAKDDTKPERVRRCYENAHMSVFEHAKVTFIVDGISRACSHQLVRHRLASFNQVSQRYVKVDTGTGWYVKPEGFDEGYEGDSFESCMRVASDSYEEALALGIKPEDARYLLPEATKTTLAVTMNVRELFHFLDLRQDRHAQWEIRGMADELQRKCYNLGGEWRDLMRLRCV